MDISSCFSPNEVKHLSSRGAPVAGRVVGSKVCQKKTDIHSLIVAPADHGYPLVMSNSSLLNMAMETMDFPTNSIVDASIVF